MQRPEGETSLVNPIKFTSVWYVPNSNHSARLKCSTAVHLGSLSLSEVVICWIGCSINSLGWLIYFFNALILELTDFFSRRNFRESEAQKQWLFLDLNQRRQTRVLVDASISTIVPCFLGLRTGLSCPQFDALVKIFESVSSPFP